MIPVQRCYISISRYIVIRHSAANSAVYIDTIEFWTYARDIAFSTTLAPDFSLHVQPDADDVHEINGC